MRGVAHSNRAKAGDFSPVDGFLHGLMPHNKPQSAVAVDNRRGRSAAIHLDIRFGVNEATLQPADI